MRGLFLIILLNCCSCALATDIAPSKYIKKDFKLVVPKTCPITKDSLHMLWHHGFLEGQMDGCVGGFKSIYKLNAKKEPTDKMMGEWKDFCTHVALSFYYKYDLLKKGK